jgi:hypothetical protein
MGMYTFVVQFVYSIVADQWIGHRDNLTAVGWIGQYLLITGHRRIETNLTDRCSGCAKRFTVKDAPVFERD